MPVPHTETTPEAAREVIDQARRAFDEMTADGQAGQEAAQGMGNYYQTDPVEKRNFEAFLAEVDARIPMFGNKILVAACGDGLETEILAGRGMDVTAFDFSPNMVEVTRKRLAALGLSATLYVDDLSNIDLSRYGTDFVGVMYAQAAAFLPVVGEDDTLLRRSITDLASRTADGAFYWSTTYYPDPIHMGEVLPAVYHARPFPSVVSMIESTGLHIVRTEQYDSSQEFPDETYKNDYVVAVRP